MMKFALNFLLRTYFIDNLTTFCDKYNVHLDLETMIRIGLTAKHIVLPTWHYMSSQLLNVAKIVYTYDMAPKLIGPSWSHHHK